MNVNWSMLELDDYNHNEKATRGKMTGSVVITCIVAASGGLLFGYDIGVSGGVTTMEPFLQKFFPSVLKKKAGAKQDDYCIYDNQTITAFTSSLYIAGMVASLIAARISVSMGRKATMLLGGSIFLIGIIITTAAVNVPMLILGRLLLGFGIGFTNQASPVYLTEMAPPKWRGMFNTGFEFFIQIGVVCATLINFWVSHYGDWGWRLAIGLGTVPALLMTIGVIFISDTPSSLVERGRLPEARKSLAQVRGVDSDIETELNDIIKTKEAAKSMNQDPFKMILQRGYRPQFVISVMIPFFQSLTGITVSAFYAPVLFQSIGVGNDAALISAVILGVVNLIAIILSGFIVDRCGRRALFLEAGVQMIICEVVIACALGFNVGASGDQPFSKGTSILVLVMMCFHSAAFGWSWGPLTWLLPSEILPLGVRPAGQGIGLAMNFGVTFILAQTFLTMLCHFKYGAFLFYAAWIVVMTTFIMLFVPETKGVCLEAMDTIWQKHWYWSRFTSNEPWQNGRASI